MELYRTDQAVISGGHFRPNVTPIMERVVSLGSLLTDRPFCQVVVYRKFPVVQVSEEFLPKFPQVIIRFTVVPAPELSDLGQFLVQPTTYPYHDLLRCQALPLTQPLPWS